MLQSDSAHRKHGVLSFSSLASSIILADMTAPAAIQIVSCFLNFLGPQLLRLQMGLDNGTYLKGLGEK